MPGQKFYLDSSALAKRYVQEQGTDQLDSIFEDSEKGDSSIVFSVWNIGELAVVLDKYEGKGLLQAREVMRRFLGETKRLGKSRAAEVVTVSVETIATATAYSLEYHVYVADALQVASCKAYPSTFVTADERLSEVAANEGLATKLVG